jgi:hypothetical protein
MVKYDENFLKYLMLLVRESIRPVVLASVGILSMVTRVSQN